MCPTDCQVICFSATFPDKVREFAANFAPGANEIKLAKNELNVDGIKQFYMDCKDEESKYQVLVDLYELLTIGQSIIFCKVSRMVPFDSLTCFRTRSISSMTILTRSLSVVD